ncbi:type II secretion system minor pseudopilin GspK [Tateyamaria sp. SN6-1]|uniref:type II secretion system minor pseudopilin GspK n=1 Tax=Tateyamaria sp. SN6-1 TaxID=3092148 RepID=UPI0039F4E0BA
MRRDSGVVLLNALVLVAAMAAAALFVLRQSETRRASLASAQEADQLTANLDAFEAYAITTLLFDNGQVDHAGERWANPGVPFDLERGQVRGTITDLQGRFNLNWMADPEDEMAQAGFATLLTQIGARPGVAGAIRGAFGFDGTGGRGYARMDPPGRPVAGPRVLMQQITRLPDLSEKDRATLAPHVTVLPGDTALNVNTVSADVLTGFFPALETERLGAVLSQRGQRPFQSVDDFLAAVEAAQGTGLGEDFDQSRLSVASDWFRVDMDASLDGRQARRVLVLKRLGTERRPQVHWRITELN